MPPWPRLAVLGCALLLSGCLDGEFGSTAKSAFHLAEMEAQGHEVDALPVMVLGIEHRNGSLADAARAHRDVRDRILYPVDALTGDGRTKRWLYAFHAPADGSWIFVVTDAREQAAVWSARASRDAAANSTLAAWLSSNVTLGDWDVDSEFAVRQVRAQMPDFESLVQTERAEIRVALAHWHGPGNATWWVQAHDPVTNETREGWVDAMDGRLRAAPVTADAGSSGLRG